MWVQSSIVNTRTSIACATSNMRNNRMRRTSAVSREILVRKLSGYCSIAYRTGSPTRSEFMCIISTACDWNQLAYCLHSKAHYLAQESPIQKNKSTIVISNICSLWRCIDLSFDRMRRVVGFPIAGHKFLLRKSNIFTFAGLSPDLLLEISSPALENKHWAAADDDGLQRYFFSSCCMWGYWIPCFFYQFRGSSWWGNILLL